MKHARLALLCLALTLGFAVSSAQAYPPNYWVLALGGGENGGLGLVIGTLSASASEDRYGPLTIYPSEHGVFVQEYMWPPDSYGNWGLCSAVYRTPVPAGGSKTFANIYLWAQNYTPPTPYRVPFRIGSEANQVPVGYTGHLVLDYVPEECAWDGPRDFWLDLALRHSFTLPLLTTTDPMQSTRFHLTVYDGPVPEPSSAAAILAGLAGLGVVMRRRRG